MTVAAVFWPGSGSSPIGKTSLGRFDDDDAFVEDAPKVAVWVCRRLGYPIMDVELTDDMIYDCFEEATIEYSSQVNEFNMRDNMIALQGSSVSGSITQKLIRGTALPYLIEVSEQYGTEAGVGGTVDWKKGYIDTVAGQQQYDLQALWAAVSESGNRLEIRRIFHERTPAISRAGYGFGDVGTGPTDGSNNLLGEFGWAGYDGGLNGMAGNGSAGQFLIMPVYETLLRTQAVEFNDQVRRSQYSFEIQNNKIRFMPIPSGERIYFQYTVKKDSLGSVLANTGSVVSDVSNAPYTNMLYTNINDVGRRWILKFTLALAKETLAKVRGKYESMPIPNGEVRLNAEQLLQEAQEEKNTLWDQLRESLEESGRAKQMEKMQKNEEAAQEIMKKVPLPFYIG